MLVETTWTAIADLGTCCLLLDVLKFPLSRRRVCSIVLRLPLSWVVMTCPLSSGVCSVVSELPLSWGVLRFDRIPFLLVVLFVVKKALSSIERVVGWCWGRATHVMYIMSIVGAFFFTSYLGHNCPIMAPRASMKSIALTEYSSVLLSGDPFGNKKDRTITSTPLVRFR